MNIPRPTVLFHIGRPDQELPHKDMSRVDKFHVENPDIKFIIVLWDEADVKDLEPKINKEKAAIVHWKDDQSLMVWLLDNLRQMIGAQIVAPKWYVCPSKHVASCTGGSVLEKCPTCNEATIMTHPFQDKMKAFADVFTLIMKLSNFDTASGQYLYSVQNPMRNVLLNMPKALGTEKEPALQCKELIGTGKGMPAIICGAGPSLEDAIPHLKRLSGKVKILCVGRAFRMLQKAGVKVDYTISVEMFDWDSVIFKGITQEEAGDTIMGYCPVSAQETTKAWPGKSVCMWDMETAAVLGREDAILGGNSVSHHTLNFAAQILNCEPLILCGIDLAYPKPRTHAAGTTPEGWPDEQTKKDAEYQNEMWVPCTGKGTDFHPECHRMPTILSQGQFLPSRQVEVRSSPAYQNFATLFSILIAKHGKKCFNASPNGQKIAGAEYLDLASYEPSALTVEAVVV